ncbi:uncharacterized protein LOC106876585 [Octopus bimaculoides]|uniref:uncharacterized protein LOC106876585 n=1 Tax=Octopus bimaculoides TaxID=37653 RepID=UPI00071CF113|nr:uncharacterized protein LOC106876585 [Octopus bimaculoides]|eukprot:XP_014780677.1 PREDICTED: uncharacterized protein LOC106876585 [Octopus bimaculoides]
MQDFYDVVQLTLDNVPRRVVIILMGDWNAKVGKSITNSSSVGQHGLGERNERGQDLVDFCITINLDIGNTIFQHHPRRLYTWTSPGDRFRNQIDYIMIQGRWRSALKNVRTRPGADCGSDHQLRSRRKQTKTIRYDITKIPEAFSVEMQNRFLLLLQSYDNGEWRSDALWEKMVNITKEVAERNIPKRRTMKRPWLSDDTLDVARRRKKAKASGNQEWRELDKQYNRQALEDKRNHLKQICLEAEDASQKGDIKSVFRLVKELSRKRKWTPRSDVINDKEGSILTEEEDIKARWRENSTDLYRRKARRSLRCTRCSRRQRTGTTQRRSEAGAVPYQEREELWQNIIRAVKNYDGGVQIGGERLCNLRYAEDTTLISNSKDQLLQLIRQVKDISAQSDLFLNVEKTKILVVDKYSTDQGDFTIDGEMIQEVDDFVCLGSTISTSG